MNYDPIKELNDENERRLNRELISMLLIGPCCFVGIILVYLFSSDIERLAMYNSELTGWTLVVGSLCGMVWMRLKVW